MGAFAVSVHHLSSEAHSSMLTAKTEQKFTPSDSVCIVACWVPTLAAVNWSAHTCFMPSQHQTASERVENYCNAGFVQDNTCVMTNLSWTIAGDDLTE